MCMTHVLCILTRTYTHVHMSRALMSMHATRYAYMALCSTILMHVISQSFGLSTFTHSVVQIFCRSVIQPVSPPVLQFDNRLVGRSVGQSVGRSVGRSVARSVARSLGRSVARSLGRSVARSLGRSVARSLGRSVARSLGRSMSLFVAAVYLCNSMYIFEYTSVCVDVRFSLC